MILYGNCEYVGKESRTSKNGNNYQVIRFDDVSTGQQYQFYWDNKNVSTLDPDQLVRHKEYSLEFNYRYNNFDHRYQVDLINIVGEVKQ